MLPVRPPLEPMLARLARELPRGGYRYEPKWDGFRCLAFVEDGEVDLRSRNDRPFSRYFPEIVESLAPLGTCVLDGELVVASPAFDFAALLARLHPAASRVERLRAETPASFIAFDLLADGTEDLRAAPFTERRARLESAIGRAGDHVALTPVTSDPDEAEGWLERLQGRGIDGVVAKPVDLPYRTGKRAMVKVKRERTADCVVAGIRLFADEPLVASLLLGLYDGDELRHVGVVAAFTEARRRELTDEFSPLVTPLEGHPWQRGFGLERSPIGRLGGSAGRWVPGEMALDWIPVRPERVCEVAYDQLDAGRFRHPARFRRWRPDRAPASCTFEQLELEPAPVPSVLPAT